MENPSKPNLLRPVCSLAIKENFVQRPLLLLESKESPVSYTSATDPATLRSSSLRKGFQSAFQTGKQIGAAIQQPGGAGVVSGVANAPSTIPRMVGYKSPTPPKPSPSKQAAPSSSAMPSSASPSSGLSNSSSTPSPSSLSPSSSSSTPSTSSTSTSGASSSSSSSHVSKGCFPKFSKEQETSKNGRGLILSPKKENSMPAPISKNGASLLSDVSELLNEQKDRDLLPQVEALFASTMLSRQMDDYEQWKFQATPYRSKAFELSAQNHRARASCLKALKEWILLKKQGKSTEQVEQKIFACKIEHTEIAADWLLLEADMLEWKASALRKKDPLQKSASTTKDVPLAKGMLSWDTQNAFEEIRWFEETPYQSQAFDLISDFMELDGKQKKINRWGEKTTTEEVKKYDDLESKMNDCRASYAKLVSKLFAWKAKSLEKGLSFRLSTPSETSLSKSLGCYFLRKVDEELHILSEKKDLKEALLLLSERAALEAELAQIQQPFTDYDPLFGFADGGEENKEKRRKIYDKINDVESRYTMIFANAFKQKSKDSKPSRKGVSVVKSFEEQGKGFRVLLKGTTDEDVNTSPGAIERSPNGNPDRPMNRTFHTSQSTSQRMPIKPS